MIVAGLVVALVAALVGVGVLLGKYHNAKTALAAVKAEVAQIKAEVAQIKAEAKGEYDAVVTTVDADVAKARAAVLSVVSRVESLL